MKKRWGGGQKAGSGKFGEHVERPGARVGGWVVGEGGAPVLGLEKVLIRAKRERKRWKMGGGCLTPLETEGRGAAGGGGGRSRSSLQERRAVSLGSEKAGIEPEEALGQARPTEPAGEEGTGAPGPSAKVGRVTPPGEIGGRQLQAREDTGA